MIELHNVSRIYGRKDNAFTALSDVSFRLPGKKTIAIVGKSGSGKSTLLHLIGGLDRPSSGEIIVNNHNLTQLTKKEMDQYRSVELGFVFQSFFVEANQTCYQNVALPLEINRILIGDRKKIIEDALSKVELDDKLNSKAGTLSGGQKQRLAIARAIVNNPSIILADEPTGNLDSATGDMVINLLFGINKSRGGTLVIVTHDQDVAKRCGVQVHISDGKISEITGVDSDYEVE